MTSIADAAGKLRESIGEMERLIHDAVRDSGVNPKMEKDGFVYYFDRNCGGGDVGRMTVTPANDNRRKSTQLVDKSCHFMVESIEILDEYLDLVQKEGAVFVQSVIDASFEVDHMVNRHTPKEDA